MCSSFARRSTGWSRRSGRFSTTPGRRGSKNARSCLQELLQQTVDFLGRRAGQLGIGIRSELPDGIVPVEADAGQIRQVLLNLLLNAIDVSSEGDDVTLRLVYEPNDTRDAGSGEDPVIPGWLVIEVADRGAGLPKEIGARIFEPFVSTKEGGTGLGLPICKRIVEEHGGALGARDREGGGAVFTIRLPVADESAQLSESRAENGQSTQAESDSSRSGG